MDFKKKRMRKNWTLGFLGIFGFMGLLPLIQGNWMEASWILWFVWFIYFVPEEEKRRNKK